MGSRYLTNFNGIPSELAFEEIERNAMATSVSSTILNVNAEPLFKSSLTAGRGREI